MRYVKIAEHYKVEVVTKLEQYHAVKMREVEAKLGMLQYLAHRNSPHTEGKGFFQDARKSEKRLVGGVEI